MENGYKNIAIKYPMDYNYFSVKLRTFHTLIYAMGASLYCLAKCMRVIRRIAKEAILPKGC